MKYLLKGLNSGTFSTLNVDTSIWSGTASGDVSGDGISIPQVTFKGLDIRVYGIYINGSVSCGNYYANGPWNCADTIQYNTLRQTTTNLTRGTNYHITDITTTQTVLLPSNPQLGDYVWYENHPSASGRYIVTVDGNGKSIRSYTNSIVTTTGAQGLFHYDGTYWVNLYEP